MPMTFQKPRNMKYTDMAIYIDENMPYIKNTGEYPNIEDKVYEYIYHIVYALSCKNDYFKNFDDYDLFACYAATEIYLSMRNKLINEGKEIRGRIVTPIKSSLNFIKSTLFPLKINFQRDNFTLILDPKVHEGAENLEKSIKSSIQKQYQSDLSESYDLAVTQIPYFITKFLDESPIRTDKLLCRRLYISSILTLINDIILPNKLKTKLDEKSKKHLDDKLTQKYINAYKNNKDKEILWHLDQNYSNYVRLIVSKTKELFSKELDYYIHSDELSDELLDSVLTAATDINYEDLGDYD